MSLTLAHVVLLVGAGALAGAVNAAAGGGSLISFPALLVAGLPALSANVTNTVALCPGYLGGVGGFRAELAGQRPAMRVLGTTAGLGAVVGVGLLEISPVATFRTVVPFLLLLGCTLLAFQPPVARWVARRRGERPPGRAALGSAVFAAGAYGAYFGAGLGVILLAVLGVLVAETLPRLNGLKAYLALVINLLAAALFVVALPVSWPGVAIMAPSSLLGGLAGASAARRIPPAVLRAAVVGIGGAVAVALLAGA
ncbi:MAG TPA: sulfite exporter TauE/SafE family protein [Solirubrobacteraceae bacterium]|nr:sulfite exporter TauE/SafE family protein [Solirubrobacteraceae bacterium]